MKQFSLLKNLFFFFCLMLITTSCQRQAPTAEERIEALGKELRCPVCRGVPIADSPAELAKEMMNVVREQVALGKSDQEVLDYFEGRYGEWALLAPKAEGLNWGIWILPLILVGGGLIVVRRYSKDHLKKDKD